jgi:hypothetical protein
MYNNDDWRQGRPNIPDYEKISKKSFWQRYRWIIISAISAVLVLFFASTTLYLLLNRPTAQNPAVVAPRSTQAAAPAPAATEAPTQAPTATSQASLSATPSSSTPQPTTNLSPTSTNYQFVCLNDCRGKIGVTLSSINVDTNAQTMVWNFNITNNGDCGRISGSLSLEPLAGGRIDANGGTFTEGIDFNSGQTLPRSATFSTIPKHGSPYTATLSMSCSSNYANDSYQPVLFNY